MPIVFVHGVANRDGKLLWEASKGPLEQFLRRHVAPAIAADPAGVSILLPYWGDLGAAFAWGGISRPHSAFLAHGARPTGAAEQALVTAEYQRTLGAAPADASPAAPGWIAHGAAGNAPPLDLGELSPDDLGDLISTLLHAILTDPDAYARAALLADEVAQDPNTMLALRQCPPGDAQVQRLGELLEHALDPGSGLVGHGPGGRFAEFRGRLGETVSRALGLPGWLATQLLSEVRAPIHEALTVFFGDVFRYLAARGTADEPGPIPARILATLLEAQKIQHQRGGEPIVVLSHSMGGQIVYDLVTTFLPSLAPTLKIDFWAASASQVGLMEELKLFLGSSDQYSAALNNMVPNPAGPQLGHWWNIWDPNDFLSFTARGIFTDVDDSSFDSGLSLVTAHGGYLIRPSFFRELAARSRQAVG